MVDAGRGWNCTAYGPDLPMPDPCFFEAVQVCGSLDECRRRMKAERQRVFDRIQERAAAGDPAFTYLAAEFTSPEQLLNAEDEPAEGV